MKQHTSHLSHVQKVQSGDDKKLKVAMKNLHSSCLTSLSYICPTQRKTTTETIYLTCQLAFLWWVPKGTCGMEINTTNNLKVQILNHCLFTVPRHHTSKRLEVGSASKPTLSHIPIHNSNYLVQYWSTKARSQKNKIKKNPSIVKERSQA